MRDTLFSWRKLGFYFGAATLVAVATTGIARADNDGGVTKTAQTTVAANPVSCSFSEGTPTTSSTSFSFDISWIDSANRIYLLADRSHGTATSDFEGGTLTNPNSGDLLLINVDHPGSSTALVPPSNDPFAGIRCDANAAFGGTNSAGRNEITGPNGVYTVQPTSGNEEAWAGDGPSHFTPGQTNHASDYSTDPCDSSVRVFDMVSGEQTDHINVGGCFRTDEGSFDPVDQFALFANPSEQPGIPSSHATALNQSPYITIISTKTPPRGQHHKILKQINFDGTNGTILADGGIEQSVYSKDTGLFYISIPGNSSNAGGYVTVLDPKGGATHLRVLKNIKLSNCSPNGAALGPDGELLVGCSSGPEQVIDINKPNVQTIINGTTGGCDEVAYNAGTNSFYGACTDSNPQSTDNLDITDAGKHIQFDTGLNTGATGAHSVAADSTTATEWMPMFQGVCGSGIACVAVFGTPGS